MLAMNKSELIESLAVTYGLSGKKAEEVVNTVVDALTDALKSGERIEIRGFGSFVVNEYKSYIGRNPKTGQPIEVKPKKLPFFKVGKELREKISR